MQPNIYIIAGPNGAGKTTFAREFLPHYANCPIFINADLIAQDVSPFLPEAAAFRSGRLMLAEIALYARRRADFGFETTLSGHSHLKLISDLKKTGYKTHIFYLWVPRIKLVLDRIKQRVQRGGHNVPETVVRRRFERSIRNFLTKYRLLAESWTLFDNSGESPKLVASEVGSKISIIATAEYRSLVARYSGE